MEDQVLLPKGHVFLHSAADMDTLLTPLKSVGIQYFTFMRNFNNGEQIYLSSIAGWVEDYYQQGLYRQFISDSPDKYKSCCLVWPKGKNLPVFDLAKERYNSDNGVTYVKKRKDYTDYYFFSTTVDNVNIINLYMNHGDIFERFIIYFEDRAALLVKKANESKVKLPSNIKNAIPNDGINTYCDSTDIAKAIKEMNIRKYILKGNEYCGAKLSRQEISCVINYVNHCTAEETGKNMNISKRTVETYFESMKNKLGCDSKSDIVRLLIEDGFDMLNGEIVT